MGMMLITQMIRSKVFIWELDILEDSAGVKVQVKVQALDQLVLED